MGGDIGNFFKNMGNTNVTDPNQANWGDLDTSEKGARVTSGLMGGLGKGLQTRQPMQQGGGAAPIPGTPTPTVPNTFDPNYLDAWRQGFGGR